MPILYHAPRSCFRKITSLAALLCGSVLAAFAHPATGKASTPVALAANAFGVYTEDAAITQKLAYGQDANLFVWNNLVSLPGATPYEGAEVLAFRAGPGNWFGFGIANNPRDVSAFAGGSYKFSFKTTYAGFFKVGIKTGGGESWIEFPANVSKYGLVRDGQWHEVVIPLSAFANATLATLDQAFMFAGDAPAADADFHIDNIYFSSEAAGPGGDGWNLVWADEFTGGIGPDWVFETGRGDNGWGNNELQYYRQENTSVQNGELVITARKESFAGAAYTSARLKTQGKKAFKYGRIEAKIAMPAAKGLWPAFWMLGSSIGFEGWPSCGEIDIMEHVNAEPNVHGTIHWSSDNGAYANYGGNTPADVTVAHVYSVEWDASAIRWFVDGVKFHEASILNGINGTHEFHEPHFLLLNMAVGGNWPGFTIDDTAFPANMYVDYVRVYQQAPPPYAGPTVRLTAPVNNALVAPGTTVAITARAGDDVHPITKVEFFNGGTLLGADDTVPYTFSWTGVAAGTYSLTAKVTNAIGLTATSAPVQVVAKDNTVTGDYFGIYTEQPTIPNKLVYTQDANLWIWNNLTNIAPAPPPFEGNEALAFRAGPGNWFGFGVDNDLKNLGSYANGALKFHFKTAYAGHFKVGIKSATAEKWIDFWPGTEKYGLLRDGQWHEVVIPFGEFGTFDLTTLDQAFMFAGEAPAVNADFYFDNIYYSAKPADGDGDGYAAGADCNDNNPAVYPGAPELCDNLDNDCDGSVDEGIQMAAPTITVTPASNVYTGGNAKIIYLGYGPQSVTLTAAAPSATAYAWSPAAGLSQSTVANPVFTPTAAGTYNFTVTATNAAGCGATAPVTIVVVNARGAKNPNKVLVCHKGQVQEVSAGEVPAHLRHGDKLGACNAAGRRGDASLLAADGLVVYPNPTGGKTSIAFAGVAEGDYRLALYDVKGVLVREIAAGRSLGDQPLHFELNGTQFAKGVYVLKLATARGVYTKRLLVQHP